MEESKNTNFYKDIYVGKYGDRDEIANQAGYILELCEAQSSLLTTLDKNTWKQIEKELLILQGDVPRDVDQDLLEEIAETKYTLYSAKKYFISKKTKEAEKNHLQELQRKL